MEKKDQANQYFKDGNYDQAVKIYNELLDLDDTNYAILSNRSAAYIKMEKYDLINQNNAEEQEENKVEKNEENNDEPLKNNFKTYLQKLQNKKCYLLFFKMPTIAMSYSICIILLRIIIMNI